VGLLVAVSGLVYLLLPGLAAPPLAGAALMVVAGASWGFYSARGRGSTDPLGQTRTNFLLAVPMSLLPLAAMLPRLHVGTTGLLAALVSGAVTSGLGYVVWYRALRHVSGVGAAIVQLATPVITAVGGVLLLGEPLSWRLVLAGALVLGGIWTAVGRAR
jgi:drug/metabolite transporter (DMT)-like permease